ncbi:MAG: DNA polymerase III subunit alpha, partial [Deltaproteobacteria bacterium]|nr:DNA polymerase III subunit alpha [Deltaproteobacteria bacterium]
GRGAGPALVADEVYVEREEWTEKERLAAEKDALGFFVSGHPLDRYRHDLPRLCTTHTGSLAQLADRPGGRSGEVTLGGVVIAYKERPLKSGDGRMAFVTLEDLHGHCEVLVFSKVFNVCEAILKSGEPILVKGVPLVEGDEAVEVKLRANAVELLSDVRARKTRRLEIAVPVDMVSSERLTKLRDLLSAHKGEVPARVTVTEPELFETVIALPESLKVNPSEDLLARVDQLFGQRVVRLL